MSATSRGFAYLGTCEICGRTHKAALFVGESAVAGAEPIQIRCVCDGEVSVDLVPELQVEPDDHDTHVLRSPYSGRLYGIAFNSIGGAESVDVTELDDESTEDLD